MSSVLPQTGKKTNSIWTFWLIAFATMLPIGLSAILYFGGWRPSGGSINHGEFVQPPRPVVNVPLQTLDGKAMQSNDLRQKWTLVFFAASSCSELCQRGAFAMRQIHMAQGKDGTRVQSVLLLTDNAELAGLPAKLADYPGMKVIVGPQESVAKLVGQFTLQPGKFENDRIYLMDPLGNLMMSQKLHEDPKVMSGFLQDLSHLLKNSWVG